MPSDSDQDNNNRVATTGLNSSDRSVETPRAGISINAGPSKPKPPPLPTKQWNRATHSAASMNAGETTQRSVKLPAPALTKGGSRETPRRGASKCCHTPRNQRQLQPPLCSRSTDKPTMVNRQWRIVVHSATHTAAPPCRPQCLEITGSQWVRY